MTEARRPACSIQEGRLIVCDLELQTLMDLCSLFVAAGHAEEQVRVRIETPDALNWDRLLNLSEYHCVSPVINTVLNRYFSDCVPTSATQRLSEICRDVERRSFALGGELIRLRHLFQSAGISFLTIKGPTLAQMVYGDVMLRDFRDLDVLIEKKDAVAVFKLMKEAGFSPQLQICEHELIDYMHFCGQLPFRRVLGSPLVIDVHWELHSLKPEKSYFFWKQQSSFFTKDFDTLSPEMLMLFLCTHGTVDNWERLKSILDVALAAKGLSPEELNAIVQLAAELKVERQLQLGLAAVCQLCPDAVPGYGNLELRQSQSLNHIATIFSSYGNIAPTLKEQKELSLRLQARETGMIAASTTRILKVLFVPNLEDWLSMRLPSRLFGVYYVTRPFRVLVSKLFGKSSLS